MRHEVVRVIVCASKYLGLTHATIAYVPAIAGAIVGGRTQVEASRIRVAVVLVLTTARDDAGAIVPCCICIVIVGNCIHAASDILDAGPVVSVCR